MFCTNCGLKGTGNFCASCGTKHGPVADQESVPEVLPVDWEHEFRYEVLLRVPEVRDRLSKCGSARKKMTGEEWLGLSDHIFKPLCHGVSLKTVATIALPIYTKMGIKTGKTRTEVVTEPVGRVIVNVLCALAETGLPLAAVHQGDAGCVIEAKLPSDLWSFEGQLVVTIERTNTGTSVGAQTNIPGQWYDWGKSAKYLQQLFGYLQTKAA